MREVTVGWAGGRFSQDIDVGGHRLRSDEEVEQGGEGSGPAPHELLLAALGACTAMTLKVYAERKGWPLRDVHVTLNGSTGEQGLLINLQLQLIGELDAEQRQRLMEIAARCPVHKSLSGPITIHSTAVPA